MGHFIEKRAMTSLNILTDFGYRERKMLMKRVKFILVLVLLCLASASAGYALAPSESHMDCTWEAWENRSFRTDEIDYRERAVAACVKLTIDRGTPETCESSRYTSAEYLIESDVDMARLVLDFLHQMAVAGQCMAHDGSYWFDLGGWNHEAIEAQKILISWLEQAELE